MLGVPMFLSMTIFSWLFAWANNFANVNIFSLVVLYCPALAENWSSASLYILKTNCIKVCLYIALVAFDVNKMEIVQRYHYLVIIIGHWRQLFHMQRVAYCPVLSADSWAWPFLVTILGKEQHEHLLKCFLWRSTKAKVMGLEWRESE